MKITPINMLLNYEGNSKLPGQNKFDRLIEDEIYYRCHKGKWEQSQLKFDKPQNEQRSQIPLTESKINGNYQSQIQKHLANAGSDKKQIGSFKKMITPDETFHELNKNYVSISKVSGKNENHILVALPKQLSYIIKKTYKKTFLTQIKVAADFTYINNHQIYFTGKEVELALNKLNLSDKQLSELLAFIKKYLYQNGFTLRKVVISGEQK